ncbi:MAG: hypothetical protein WDM78_11340 [Puia sp.]
MVESKNLAKRNDPLLFTTGGPGGSSLGWAVGAARHSLINDRDCIAFEQRGTQYAVPNLWSTELSDAIKESYRRNLNKDSMVIEGVRRYKKALEARGVDLSGYNTDETVADIHDLLATLQIDSVNLTAVHTVADSCWQFCKKILHASGHLYSTLSASHICSDR